MTLMQSILAPPFLANNISSIALICGAVILVLFSDFVNRKIIFPLGDWVSKKTYSTIKGSAKSSLGQEVLSFLSKSLATVIFLFYCFLGSVILAQYIIGPILSNLRSVILIVVICLFALLTVVINSKTLRTKIMRF